MSRRSEYKPGPAHGAQVEKDGASWALVIVREFRHAPEHVWAALTDPGQLREWAPFDANQSLGQAGAVVSLSTLGAPTPIVSETTITRADGHVLEYAWGGNAMRWELEPAGRGTRLTLWHRIDRGFIAWGAAGWHICFDVLAHALDGQPIGRIIAAEAMAFDWPRLNAEYSAQFGIEVQTFRGVGAS